MVGLAPEVEPPAAVRPDRGGDAHRVAGEVQRPALLDVEFHERADPLQPLRIGADGLRVVPGALHRLRQRHAVRVAQLPRLPGGELPGAQAGADAGEPEAGALLVTEVDDGQRLRELRPPPAEFVERGEGGDDAERPVEGAAVRDGVQVRARDDGVARRRVAEPRPLVAVAVQLVRQAAGLGLGAEPGAAVGVGGRPGVAAVASGGRVAAEGGEVAPHLLEGGWFSPSPARSRNRGCAPGPPSARGLVLKRRTGSIPGGTVGRSHAPSPSRIGMRTPRSAATSSARSYPASTCRMTPMPGSLVSTRRIFSPASFVPSATET